jgi:hypothetical protein
MTKVEHGNVTTRRQAYGDYAVDLEEYSKAPYLSQNPYNTKRFVVHRYHKGKMTHYWWYRLRWMAKWRFHEEIAKILPRGIE